MVALLNGLTVTCFACEEVQVEAYSTLDQNGKPKNKEWREEQIPDFYRVMIQSIKEPELENDLLRTLSKR